MSDDPIAGMARVIDEHVYANDGGALVGLAAWAYALERLRTWKWADWTDEEFLDAFAQSVGLQMPRGGPPERQEGHPGPGSDHEAFRHSDTILDGPAGPPHAWRTRSMTETRPLPELPDRCPGECGGFGTHPSEFGRWLDADERLAWQLAEARDPSPDGVHHVRCSICGGTGRRR